MRESARATKSLPCVALIGCGAVVEAYYSPGIRESSQAGDAIVLVDRDSERTRILAERLGVPETHCRSDHRTVLDDIDGAIVAVPPAAHYAIVKDCLEHGVHVLCEKPLTESPHEAHELVQLAEKRDLVLAVNNTRRASPAARRVKQVVRSGTLGPIRRVEYYEGGTFDWPTVSGFYFDHRVNTKGVLMDRGSHVVDLVCWWLDARPQLVDYQDDSFGGPEAVAKMRLAHGECQGTVMLSHLNKLRNTFRILGDRGSISGGIYDWRNLTLEDADGTRSVKVRGKGRNLKDFVATILNNFIDCLQGQARPLIPAAEVLHSIELLDECYRRRTRFPMPWYDELEAIHEL